MENYSDKNTSANYLKILNDLFWKAFKANRFDTICSILRVGGMSDANWDSFEESRKAFDDFNWVLKKVSQKRSRKSQRRIGLLIYCQAVEMTAPHEILLNLLNCLLNKGYRIDPFSNLRKRQKKIPFLRIPPSATAKFKNIFILANNAGEDDLIKSIKNFFNENIRNAFSHSDYILTRYYFRYSYKGLARQIRLEELDKLIVECFGFYGAFLHLHKKWLLELSKLNKFHKWPNYEVLELLTNEKEGLYGFRIHFSNGSNATYTRQKKGIEAINIVFENDGQVNFMCGCLDDLEPVWKVKGIPVENWDELP